MWCSLFRPISLANYPSVMNSLPVSLVLIARMHAPMVRGV
nr:MAG TPA: hypothetical protein [Caudoviricetes sp.]